MRVCHTSDLHGQYKPLLKTTEPFDVWLDTGDFLPTKGRHKSNTGRISAGLEYSHQVRWFKYKKLAERLAKWLDGRPAIICPGNHDFASLTIMLRTANVKVYPVTPQGFEYSGYKWAGFPDVNWIDGEWNHENRDEDLEDVTDKTFMSNPDILVTHAPPFGILDENGFGLKYTSNLLQYTTHNVEHHFFGHCHEDGGQEEEVMQIMFYNGAGAIAFHDL